MSLLERLRDDPDIANAVKTGDPPNKMTGGLIPRAGDKLPEYLSQFTVSIDEIERKTAEIINTCVYVMACAQRPGKTEMFDFFLMHCVNVSIFLPALMKQHWISPQNKCRLLEWMARFDIAAYACGVPKLYPERVFAYQSKKLGGWESIFRRATSYKDDGHVAELTRAVKNGEIVTRPYNGQPGFPLPVDAFLTVAHMVMDSVERMNEPDYEQPKPPGYMPDLNPEVLRVTVRWVRWCGLDEAWDQVPALSGNSKL